MKTSCHSCGSIEPCNCSPQEKARGFAASFKPASDSAPSPLLEAAVYMHEMFTTYVEAGFTEDQALKIVISYALEMLRQGAEKKDSDN